MWTYMCLGFRRLGHSWVVLVLKVACNISLSKVHFVSTTEVGLEGYFCIHAVWLCICTGKSTRDHPHYVCTYHWSIWMETTRKGTKHTKLNRYERVKRHGLIVLQEVMKPLHLRKKVSRPKVSMYTKEEYLQLKIELHFSKMEADSLWEEKLELEKKYKIAVSELHRLKTSADDAICGAAIKDNDTKTKFYIQLSTYLQLFSTFCVHLCTGLPSLVLWMSCCLC